MSRNHASSAKQRQAPLRERYRVEPEAARITDGARCVHVISDDPFHGSVVPNNASDAPWRVGIHRAVGGDHDHPNPGDILCAALAACFSSTLRILADHGCFQLESLEVSVTAEIDVRGCLLVDPAVPVGFQRIQVHVRLQPKGQVDPGAIQGLVAATERCCVVLQTLRSGVLVQSQVEIPERG
jgi:uncharacterized OsmC-like protein